VILQNGQNDGLNEPIAPLKKDYVIARVQARRTTSRQSNFAK